MMGLDAGCRATLGSSLARVETNELGMGAHTGGRGPRKEVWSHIMTDARQVILHHPASASSSVAGGAQMELPPSGSQSEALLRTAVVRSPSCSKQTEPSARQWRKVAPEDQGWRAATPARSSRAWLLETRAPERSLGIHGGALLELGFCFPH
jgi:hypothetical protein